MIIFWVSWFLSKTGISLDPICEPDDERLAYLLVFSSEVSSSREAPVDVSDDPGLERIDELHNVQVQIRELAEKLKRSSNTSNPSANMKTRIGTSVGVLE